MLKVLLKAHLSAYPFNEEKASEAAALLTELNNEPIGRLRLLKLLYLTDRKSIDQRDRPICGGKYSSMDNGPVLSAVYNLIRGEIEGPTWGRYLRQADHPNVKLVRGLELAALSKYEVELLTATFNEFKEMSDHELWLYVHDPENLPEYEEPPQGTSRPIHAERLLAELGRTKDEIREIAETVHAETLVTSYFAD